MKNGKFLLDIQTKCGDIANEILNAAIDVEQTFKCKWPNSMFDELKEVKYFKELTHFKNLIM